MISHHTGLVEEVESKRRREARAMITTSSRVKFNNNRCLPIKLYINIYLLKIPLKGSRLI